MGGFDIAFQRELARNTWPMYGVGMFIILLRMYARIHRHGIRGLAPDDYLMLSAGALYTTLVVCLNIIATGGGSNLFLPEEYPTFDEEEIQDRIKGSKIVVLSEQAMLCVIYNLKACLLFMYYRLTTGSNQQRMVKWLAAYVFLAWVGTEFAFFFACRPFSGYWAVPPPNPQCTTLEHYAISQMCFNITSDLLMLGIPIALVSGLSLPLKQKIVLGIVFSMGVFVIIAAILTKYYNLSNVYDTSYMLWYFREASVAVYVANLPMIWPLLREWFPFLRDLSTATGAGPSAALPRYNKDGFTQPSDIRSATGTVGNASSSGRGHHRSKLSSLTSSAVGRSLGMHRLSSIEGAASGSSSTQDIKLQEGLSSPTTAAPAPAAQHHQHHRSAHPHFDAGLERLGIRRPATPESDERALHGGDVEKSAASGGGSGGAAGGNGGGWGIAPIRAQVHIEIERDSDSEVERHVGGAGRGGSQVGWQDQARQMREVRIEGGGEGRRKD
ncbi:hypothetical protein BDY21DRAFT_184732 [Lineolata rhizophorae]|uniref:Rhodopsin domain-containing protein n=1 Tax=Lineolata rhizophorae TaxID=578093 RepID=A0A6A6P880_9PEZI|nr:hypothetical protein BDY21DRAFT_184732 [Lineolata rhizophorae]